MENQSAFNSVLDGLDIETYLVCRDAMEGKHLALQLGKEMNLGDVDIMYEEYDGYGMRVRLRKYIVKPGQTYPWLK
ncbi:MAG: hypothetical protein M0R68_06965 [Bacteroidetes bacterium]|nr:hypothetical protein [Bacteroidota bacterium]